MKNSEADTAWWQDWSFLFPGSNWAKTLNSACKAAADWNRICLDKENWNLLLCKKSAS